MQTLKIARLHTKNTQLPTFRPGGVYTILRSRVMYTHGTSPFRLAATQTLEPIPLLMIFLMP